ncbi:MAG: hydrogenase maturation protease [Vicinamibacterales bacterium]
MTLADVSGRPLLIYGIGNPGRQDDGLGPAVVERLVAAGVPGSITLESGYQLVPEDALLLSSHACVIFVDAIDATAGTAPYSVYAVTPEAEVSFTSHALSPGALLTLCRRLYGVQPAAYALAIPAYSFEVNADFSTAAAEHLEHAVNDLRRVLTAASSA